MKVSRALVAMVAACLTLGLAAAPAALAADAKANAAAGVTTKSVNKKLNSTRKDVRSAKRRLTRLSKNLGTLSGRVKKAEGSLGTVLAAAPALISGLQTLSGVVQNQIAPGLTRAGEGLTALKGVLETQIGPGLTRLRDFVGADEYGIVQVTVGADNGTAIPGCFVESPDIPDNVQSAIVTASCIIPGTANPGDRINFLAGIRSNEDDGTGATKPAGVAGIVNYHQRGGNGDVAGAGATTPAAAGQPPAVAIPDRSAMTSTTETGFPFQPISSDKLVNLSTTQFTGQPAAPTVAAAGNIITFTIRFVDTSPDANNPKA